MSALVYISFLTPEQHPMTYGGRKSFIQELQVWVVLSIKQVRNPNLLRAAEDNVLVH